MIVFWWLGFALIIIIIITMIIIIIIIIIIILIVIISILNMIEIASNSEKIRVPNEI